MTDKTVLPVPLAWGVMRVAPAPILQRMVDILIRKMENRHPRLFKNLKRLPASNVLIEPSDLPHRFILRFGGQSARLELAESGEEISADATIKGTLEALLDMLEGRTDGDTLFFSRQIVVSGDSEVIVGLRNTLDREALNLMDDLGSLFGPFARPAIHALSVAGKVVAKIKTIRGQRKTPNDGDTRAMRREIDELKARLAAYERKAAS